MSGLPSAATLAGCHKSLSGCVGTGFRVAGLISLSPLLGEHADEILREVLGFSDHQMAEIHDSGALDPPRKQAAE
jgi:hypothetical protein